MAIDPDALAYVESFLSPQRLEKFHRVLAQRTLHFTVATEDVYQLHNTSAVIRSCDVFGVQDVHIVEEVNTKKIDREIAMGAQKWVDIHRHHSVKACLTQLKQSGYQIVATTPHANDCALSDFDISKKSCFFFGRETDGLSDEVLSQADAFLKIPMVGFTESLNISVSAAIILQHTTNALRKSEINWQLTPNELLEKRWDWTKKTIKSFDEILSRYTPK